MKFLFNRYYIFILILFFLTIPISGQSSQPQIEELKKLQDKYVSEKPEKKSRLLKGLIDDKKNISELGKKEKTPEDSITYDPILDKVSKEQKAFSVYKNIINDEIINPDIALKNIEIFGHSVFNKRQRLAFSSTDQISIPHNYHISSGDEINIMIWGRINEEHHLTVDRNGRINIPRIGPVYVAGLPFSTMKKNIIKRVESIEGVNATISMGTLSNIQIYIVGEVNFPGQYTVNALTNPINAIFYANGFSNHGSMRNVKLKRNGKTIKNFDFYKFLLAGNNFSNIRLKSGDVIFVPIVKTMAAIAGNVRRGALYELKGKTTLKDFINLAGGLTPAAWTNRIQVERFEESKQQILFDFQASSKESLSDIEIEDGDIVKIFPIVKLDKKAVYLTGNVLRPGKYEYHENMRITDIINNYEQLLPETYFNYSIIRRKEPPTFAERIISFNFGDILENNSSKDNFYLKPLDHIIIFNRDYFQPDRTVSIDGAVTNPNTYKLLQNMTIKDLILEAGGLREDASIERGELYKRIHSHDSVHTQKIDFIINEAMNNNPSHNHLLSKLDYVYIRRKRGWEEKQTITLVGEFNFPGEYIILENETLGELITRCAGFKPEAYLAAAIFTRESVKKLENKRRDDYIKQLELDIVTVTNEAATKTEIGPDLQAFLEQQQSLLEKLKSYEAVGRVVIDFLNERNYKDLKIEDGDMLYVPKNKSTISVIGEVFNPSTFVLNKSIKKLDYYIQLSGGLKQNANKKNIYVIKANGSVRTRQMVNLAKYNLESGDAVIVPYKLPEKSGRFKMFLETMESITLLTTSSLNITTNMILLGEKLR